MSGNGGMFLFSVLLILSLILFLDAKTDEKPCGKTETVLETAQRQNKKSQFYEELKKEAFFTALKEDEKQCKETLSSNKATEQAKEFLKTADIETQYAEISKANSMIRMNIFFKNLLSQYSDDYACVRNIAIPFYAYFSFYPHDFKHQNKTYINNLVKTLEKTKLQEQNNFCS